MGGEDKPSDCWGCATHRAVLRFAEARHAVLGKKVVFALQRMGASGIYGEDFQYKTLWDEYCHEIQNGPHNLLEWAWDTTLYPLLQTVIDAVPEHEKPLLSIGAAWDLDEVIDPGVTTLDLVRRNLERIVGSQAGARDMSRFDPNR